MRLVGSIVDNGAEVDVLSHSDGRVTFTAGAAICADGANGQHGMRPAYAVGNAGSDDLANGGMAMVRGKVVGVQSWFKDVVIFDKDFEPKVFPGGVIASKTAYKFHDKSKDDPNAYIDSETVPYIVVPPMIIQGVPGIVLGCRCVVTNTENGKSCAGMVADIGPHNKIGEISIKMARELGIAESPRYGGMDEPNLNYELWPGECAVIAGVTYPLQPS